MTNTMGDVLCAFLAQHAARTEESINWGDMPLRVSSYLTSELPPMQYVTSVRAVVISQDAVLVLHDGSNHHVLPGGRIESGESFEATLHREVLEKTGYALRNAKVLGFMHFRHLGPKPEGYEYPYPDFLQLAYTAQPRDYFPNRVAEDVYVKWSGMMPMKDVLSLPLDQGERMYLMAARERRA
jgi:ADP-ribose pyrophosphatase YjhB (NUDIX family)